MEHSAYKEEVYTKRVRAGKRTYFFDVRPTRSEKDFYITITESRRITDQEFEKHKIFLYKEDFGKFIDALDETVDFVQAALEREEIEKVPPAVIESEMAEVE
ncbi:MAG: DUF3276 family protein [Ignavibacteriales bacterium]|nr:DUF3276 family protein [Ignavibacteriales bacterium]